MSRQQRSLTRYFPEVVEALTAGFAGEVAIELSDRRGDREGRLSEARHRETSQPMPWHDLPAEARAGATLEAYYWLCAARSVGLAR